MESRSTTDLPTVANAYNGKDRNAFLFGWNPQAELWNGRLAMIGFVAYLLWDLNGYSFSQASYLLPCRWVSDLNVC
jgi:hypothetical protein